MEKINKTIFDKYKKQVCVGDILYSEQAFYLNKGVAVVTEKDAHLYGTFVIISNENEWVEVVNETPFRLDTIFYNKKLSESEIQLIDFQFLGNMNNEPQYTTLDYVSATFNP